MKPKFTKQPLAVSIGRWEKRKNGRLSRAVFVHTWNNAKLICVMVPGCNTTVSIKEATANAHLIAAAPQLYEQLQDALSYVENHAYQYSGPAHYARLMQLDIERIKATLKKANP